MTEKRVGSLVGRAAVLCTPFPQTADRSCPDPVSDKEGKINNE